MPDQVNRLARRLIGVWYGLGRRHDRLVAFLATNLSAPTLEILSRPHRPGRLLSTSCRNRAQAEGVRIPPGGPLLSWAAKKALIEKRRRLRLLPQCLRGPTLQQMIETIAAMEAAQAGQAPAGKTPHGPRSASPDDNTPPVVGNGEPPHA